ncbi:MAG: DUF4364 family protein [Oscillospiraceae bacterium]|nr:DUF4364 family protein [Oscillospiraceae bacterium]
MANGTFTAGVVPGGLTDHTEIKILLCCVLRALGEPVEKAVLLSAFTENGYANYFECADALSDLEAAGHLLQSGNECYSVTDSGKRIAAQLCGDVPLTVRERVTARAAALWKRRKNEAVHHTRILHRDLDYLVECSLFDQQGGELFSLRLAAPTLEIAQHMRDAFIDNGEAVVRSATEQLTGEVLH